MTSIQFILIAAFGAAVQEIIHLYDIRSSLGDPSSVLKSWKYWAITITMIVVSGVGTWLLYGDNLTIRSVIFILGAAFPLLFKKLVNGIGNNPPPAVQPRTQTFTARDYFV